VALVKDGIEWVKTYPTGDAARPTSTIITTLCMTFEEMHAVVARRAARSVMPAWRATRLERVQPSNDACIS